MSVDVVGPTLPEEPQWAICQRHSNALTMDGLSSDLLVIVFTYLSASDICRSQRTCRKFHALKVDSYLWDSVLRSAAVPSLVATITSTTCAWDSHEYNHRKYHAARQLEAMSTLDRVCWSQLNHSNSANPGGPRLEKMEAHTMTLLLGRFAVIVGGWSDSSDNRIEVIDCNTLHAIGHGTAISSPQRLTTLNTFTERTPRFRYGFSTVEHKGRLIVYGGCRGGGYSHDCNDHYSVDLCFEVNDPDSGMDVWYYANTELSPVHSNREGSVDDDTLSGMQGYSNVHRLWQGTVEGYGVQNITENIDKEHMRANRGWDNHWEAILSSPACDIHQVVAQYSANRTAPIAPLLAGYGNSSDAQLYVPITRAYHSAVVMRLDSSDCMLVWGGLHRRAPVAQLELLDLNSQQWRRGFCAGQEPSPRFGHSCVLMPGCDRCKGAVGDNEAQRGQCDKLIFTGGSDGNDLVRNGTEIREIHVLHIVRTSQKATGMKREAVKDALMWSTPQLHAVPMQLSLAQAVPGRCHCAVRAGERVLYFGGGAESTNTVQVLHAPSSREGGEYSLYLPTVAAVRGGTGRGTSELHQQRQHYPAPRGRCSATAVLSGRYVLVFGGFSVEHREMGDAWVLDLAYGTSDQYCQLDRAAARNKPATGNQAATSGGVLYGAWGRTIGTTEDGDDHPELQDQPYQTHQTMNNFMLSPGAALGWLHSFTAAAGGEGDHMNESESHSDSDSDSGNNNSESEAGLDSSSGDHASDTDDAGEG